MQAFADAAGDHCVSVLYQALCQRSSDQGRQLGQAAGLGGGGGGGGGRKSKAGGWGWLVKHFTKGPGRPC